MTRRIIDLYFPFKDAFELHEVTDYLMNIIIAK